MHEAGKKRLGSLRCEKIKGTDCAKLSSLHCLDLDPVSGKLLMLAEGEERKIEEKQTLQNSEIRILSLSTLNEFNFKAEGGKVQVNVRQDGRKVKIFHRKTLNRPRNLFKPYFNPSLVKSSGKVYMQFLNRSYAVHPVLCLWEKRKKITLF